MTPFDSDHDLLLKLHTKFDNLAEEFRRVSNGIGFPRCAERLVRLESHDEALGALHKRIDDEAKAIRQEIAEEACRAHKRIDGGNARFWWLITLFLGQAIAFIFAIVKGAINI